MLYGIGLLSQLALSHSFLPHKSYSLSLVLAFIGTLEPCLTTTPFIRPPRHYGHIRKNHWVIYYFEDPVNATTSLLRPGFYGPTVVALTGFHWCVCECLFVFPVGNWIEILSFRSIGPKCPFPFDKIVFSSTALLRPAYKYNNQTRGGVGRVCATGIYRSIGRVEFSKFQTGMFIEWKEPRLSLEFSF